MSFVVGSHDTILSVVCLILSDLTTIMLSATFTILQVKCQIIIIICK